MDDLNKFEKESRQNNFLNNFDQDLETHICEYEYCNFLKKNS